MEIILALMNLQAKRLDAVCRTSDGYYMGQAAGDIGYNAFLGRPEPVHDGPGRQAMLKVWAGLSDDEREAVLRLADNPPNGAPLLLVADFGVPVEEVAE
jgi:hypothetical protein